MSGWFGGTNASARTTYTGLNIQTSAYGVPIPLVWGRKRIGTNLIWWNDFQAQSGGKKGGGKGGGGKNSMKKYQVAAMLALCEGPITAIGTVWADKNVTTLAALGLTLFTGTASQAVWAYLTSAHPDQAVTYAYTAYLANSAYALGYSPNLPNHAFEVITPLSGTMPGTVDVNMADVINDFLTNPQYSISMASSAIDATSLAFYKTYCQAQQLFFSPDITNQEQVNQILDRWAKLTNSWIFWSGPALKFVPLGDSTIANGTSQTITVPTSVPNDPGPYTFTGYPTVTADGGVKYSNGTSLTSVGGTPSQGQYRYSAGVWTFAAADHGAAISVTYTYTYNGPTYTPNTNIIYNLTDGYSTGISDFIKTGSEAPIEVEVTDPADSPNFVKLEIKNRANSYNSATAYWKDDGLVNQFGQIDNQTQQGHEICDVNVGQVVAALIGQRDAYVRHNYRFKLGWEFFLLEPGDLVTLTDRHIGLTLFPVRIKTMDEDETGNWEVVAEEYTAGLGSVSAATTVPTSGSSNTPTSTNGLPGNVNPPAIFEPNSNVMLTGGIASLVEKASLWVAASGSSSNWGGCVVYLSFDNVNYSPIGTISAPAPQGLLTATLVNHADPDTTDTLAVDLTESLQSLDTDATHADADAYRTLSLITPAYTTTVPASSEAVSYGAAATTGTYTANLTYLRRGLYGTSPAAHAIGDFFTRLNLNQTQSPGNTMIVYQLPTQYVGVTLYFKFCSFNTFGNQLQDLSSVTAYQYTPSGVGYGGGSGGVPTTPTGLAATPGIGQNVLTWNANPTTDNVDYYVVYAATGTGQPFSSAVQIATVAQPGFTHTGVAPGSGWTYFLKAHNAVGLSAVTTGVNCTTLSTVGNLFRLSGNLAGAPTMSQNLFEVEMVGGEGFPINLTGSYGGCDTAPTGSVTCALTKNGASIGSMNIAAGATTATFIFSAAVTFAAGDILAFTAPTSVDSTLAGLHYTFIGTR